MLERLKKELGLEVNDDTIFCYDRWGLAPAQRQENNYRDYTEKEYVRLQKAVMLSNLGVDLNTIDQIINKNNAQLKDSTLKIKSKLLRILKETL